MPSEIVIFIDRDGLLKVNRNGSVLAELHYVDGWQEFRLMDGALIRSIYIDGDVQGIVLR